MEENEDLNMGLFDESNLELNIDEIPEDFTSEETDEENQSITDDESVVDTEENQEEENTSENQEDSEKVAGEEDENKEGGDDDDSPNLYSSLANVLHEQGLLPSLNLQDSKIESVDDISNAIRGEIDSNVRAKLVETLGEEGYEAVTNGVPLEELAKYKDNQTTLDSINEETLSDDIELSKKVIYQDYINQGMSEERAQRLLKRITSAGEDAVIEDAKESLNSIKTFEKQRLEQLAEQNKQAAARQAKEQEELDNKLKDTIYNSSELVKGLKLNKAIQDRVYKSITTNVGEGNGFETKLIQDRKANPVEFDAKMYYLYEVTNGFKDLDAIMKTSRTSATSDLERAIKASKTYDNSNPTFTEDSDSYYGDGDWQLVTD